MNRPEPDSPGVPAYRLRRSARARRVTLRVSAAHGLVVSAPLRTSRATIEAVVLEHRDWARQALLDAERELPEACREWPPRRLELAALGQRVVIGFEPTAPAGSAAPAGPTRPAAPARPATPSVHTLPGSDGAPVLVLGLDPDERAAVADALIGWLKLRAAEHLAPRLAMLARRHGATYRRCTVRAQRSVWGSCSTSGTVSLNCKLLFLAPTLVDYVLLHELAHTHHPDHSVRFWARLEGWQPEARALDRQLRAASRRVPPWLERGR